MQECEIVMEKAPQAVPAPGKKGQLLVVDDDKTIRLLLSRMLSLMGYDVSLAGNGLQASTMFLTGCCDLVITDLEMPLMNGLELARLVKEQSPHTPVVVITGTCDDRDWEKLNTSCVDAVIPKPFALEEIKKAVQSFLGSRS
jgi:CheY-like chemotaxis protein